MRRRGEKVVRVAGPVRVSILSRIYTTSKFEHTQLDFTFPGKAEPAEYYFQATVKAAAAADENTTESTTQTTHTHTSFSQSYTLTRAAPRRKLYGTTTTVAV